MTTDLFPRGLRAVLSGVALSGLLAGCVGVGIGVPIVPGLSLGVGYGAGGPSVGVGTGFGPVGVGVGVNGSGQVIGSGGVGVSAGAVGVGVGQSVVLSDPAAPLLVPPAAQATAPDGSGIAVERGVVVNSRSPQ